MTNMDAILDGVQRMPIRRRMTTAKLTNLSGGNSIDCHNKGRRLFYVPRSEMRQLLL